MCNIAEQRCMLRIQVQRMVLGLPTWPRRYAILGHNLPPMVGDCPCVDVDTYTILPTKQRILWA